jgi:L-threonylcarbamoyladenylate synthase
LSQTLVIAADAPGALIRALTVLEGGGLVAYPTDTVYGVGARVWDRAGVARLYAVKEREQGKAIPVLLDGAEALPLVTRDLPEAAMRLARRFWPGPLTIVVLRRPELPDEVSLGPTVGVRVPDHRVARALLEAAGPMAVTSANLSGGPSARTADEVLAGLGGRVDLILDGGRTPGGEPSTVVDCTVSPPKVLRAGPVSATDILSAIGLQSSAS